MNGIYQNYQIDLSSNNNFVQYNTVQGDGNDIRQIEIELIENNKPYVPGDDVEVFIAGTKPDTKQIFNSCEITEQGTILIDVTTQMSAVAGRGDYQIMLISKTSNQQLKSFPFILFVKEATFDVETITSSNEFHALNGMVNKIESTLNKTDLVDSMLESSSKILDDTTTAYNNAVQSLEKAQDAIETAESINSTALESAENAKQSEENSLLYSNLSKSYAVGTNDESRENDSTDNAKYYKEQAESSSASALQSANLASQKADDASASETKAQQYAANASASEANAKSSADSAKTSEENAAQSSSDALQSAANSENSAAASAQNAEKALESATNAGIAEVSAKSYAESAAGSALKAEEISKISIATPEINGIVKPDGTTITIDKDGTLHGAVSGLTVEDLSNAPHPAVNEVAGVMLTGTDANEDSPALKSIPLSDLAKGVADEIDSESLLQNYISETNFIENQARQDETIALNIDKIEKLTTRVSELETSNGNPSVDLSNYLPLSGGTMSSNAKIDFEDNQEVAIYYGKINNHQGLVIGDNGEDNNSAWTILANDVKLLNNLDAYGDVNINSDLKANDIYIDGNLLKNNIPYIDAGKVDGLLLNYNQDFHFNGIYNGPKNYYYLQFYNGILIISISIETTKFSNYNEIYFPINFINTDYQTFLGFDGDALYSGISYTHIEYPSIVKDCKYVNKLRLKHAPDLCGIDNYVEGGDRINILCIGRWK